MNKHSFLLLCLLAATCGTVRAVNHELVQQLREDYTRIGCNLHSYEFLPLQDTPAPKGYKPFYISHYGRHGSRSGWGDGRFVALQALLLRADSLGVLTDEGKELLTVATGCIAAHNGMDGRLSDRGEREHARLAERMYNRYPDVFAKGKQEVKVRSISSMVQRCLISMASFTNSLTRLNRRIQYNFDTGEQMQKYLDCAGSSRHIDAVHARTRDSLMSLIPRDTMALPMHLFTDTVGLHVGSIDRLQRQIYETATFAQDFDMDCNVFRYLNMQEVYYLIMEHTYYMALYFCNVEGIGALRIHQAQVALDDFIAKADEAIAGGDYVADLRFGHDYPLLCIVNRMGIGGVGEPLRIEDIEGTWLSHRNICMASNLQLIFYRKSNTHSSDADSPILVKVLYNEQERTIVGLTPVEGCYYRWSDIKHAWQNK